MIYTCDNCGFIFSRSEETEQCPDCGKYEVRPANEEEQKEFAQRMAELSESEHLERPRIPDFEDTEFSMFSSFSFRVPATALRIDSRMIVDIAVEYGEDPANRSELVGNVWARQEGGRSAAFLMSVHLPAKEGEAPQEQANRVFEALSDNGEFNERLVDFIKEHLK